MVGVQGLCSQSFHLSGFVRFSGFTYKISLVNTHSISDYTKEYSQDFLRIHIIFKKKAAIQINYYPQWSQEEISEKGDESFTKASGMPCFPRLDSNSHL